MSDELNEMNEIVLERREPSHYVRIPRMALRDLDPYELAVYANMKDAAGDEGYCNKSNETIAEETGMSVRKFQQVRQSLEQKGYVTLERREENGVENKTVVVRMVWLWDLNYERYGKNQGDESDASPHARDASGGRTTFTQIRTIEEEPEKKKTPSAGAEGSGPSVKSRLPSAPVDGNPLTQDLGEYRKLEEVIRDTFDPGKNWLSEASRKKLQNAISRHLANGKEEVLTAPIDLYDENPTFVKFVQRQLDFWHRREELDGKSKKYAAINSILEYFGDYGWLKYEDSVLKSGRGPEMPANAKPNIVISEDENPYG